MRRGRPKSIGPVTSVVAITLLVSALVALRWFVEVIGNSGRGLDASDESFYLLSVKYPHASRAAGTGFDSFLAPVWWLSLHSIARYRLAGLLLMCVAVSFAARWSSRPTFTMSSSSARSAVAAVVAVALAPLALSHYMLWVTTPGYNLLVLIVGLLVAGLTTSLALTPIDRMVEPSLHQALAISKESALGFILSVGIVVKAPAFLIVLALSCIALVIVRGSAGLLLYSLRLSIGFAVGLSVFVALSGSPSETARRLARGLHANQLLSAHTAETVWEVTSMRRVYGPWFAYFAIGAVTVSVLWRWLRRYDARLIVTGLGSVVTAILFCRRLPGGGSGGVGANAGWWWIRFSAMTLLWSTANARAASRQLALGPIVALMAVGASAGSNNGVIHQTALTVGILGVGLAVQALVVVSSAHRIDPDGGRRVQLAAAMVPIALFFSVGAIAANHMLREALRSPYRLNGALHAENVGVELGGVGRIDVHPQTARYVNDMHRIGAEIPEEARDCLVDLAGGTPLAALALDVRPASVPWIIGGYAGSSEFANYVLSGSPCLAGPYVLIEAPNGERAVPRPAWVDTSTATLLGRAEYAGYLTEEQFVWLVPAPSPPSP